MQTLETISERISEAASKHDLRELSEVGLAISSFNPVDRIRQRRGEFQLLLEMRAALQAEKKFADKPSAIPYNDSTTFGSALLPSLRDDNEEEKRLKSKIEDQQKENRLNNSRTMHLAEIDKLISGNNNRIVFNCALSYGGSDADENELSDNIRKLGDDKKIIDKIIALRRERRLK